MLIRDIGSNRPYHVPTESAKKFIAAGLAVEVVMCGPNPYPRNMRFYVALAEDGLSPFITYSCGCGVSGHIAGPNAHRTQKVGHCGIQEPVPSATAALYEKYLRKKKSHEERTRNSEHTGKLAALRSRP